MDTRRPLRAPLGAPATVQAAPKDEALTKSTLEQLFPSLFAVKPTEVIGFSRQIATLLETGVPLLGGLQLLSQQSGASRGFKAVLGRMSEDLESGSSFGQAVGRHPDIFNEVYRRTATIGERTGQMETVLRQLADFMEKQNIMAKKFSSAMTYPAIILVVGLIVAVILTTTALPPLVDMFTELEVDLPLPTVILIAFTNFVGDYTLYLFGGIMAVLALAVYWFKQPSGRRAIDRARLFAPIIGPPLLMGELARFSRTLSMLTGAGVTLQEIFEVLPQTSSNHVMRDSLTRVKDGLMLGQGLSGPMSKTEVFPPLLVQMAAVGEESNSISYTMDGVAKFYEQSAEERIGALVSFLTPAIIVVIAMAVAFIALSVIMPMYSVTGTFAD